MTERDISESVSVATIFGQLPEPIVFGDWVMQQRGRAL
jgi:hypothetical protein